MEWGLGFRTSMCQWFLFDRKSRVAVGSWRAAVVARADTWPKWVRIFPDLGLGKGLVCRRAVLQRAMGRFCFSRLF
jgi:hypothetical protein